MKWCENNECDYSDGVDACLYDDVVILNETNVPCKRERRVMERPPIVPINVLLDVQERLTIAEARITDLTAEVRRLELLVSLQRKEEHSERSNHRAEV